MLVRDGQATALGELDGELCTRGTEFPDPPG